MEGHIQYFREELNRYFDFHEDFDLISSHEKTDGIYRVYLTDIRQEYLTIAPGHKSVIIKEISPRQAEIYRRISGTWNPYIETVYGVLEREGHFLAVNEFVKAPEVLRYHNRSINLEEYIENYGCLSEKDALTLLFWLCSGVEALRKMNLTHGDISPRNILLTDFPEWNIPVLPRKKTAVCGIMPTIIDFDISKVSKQNDHEVTTIVGTSMFAAPEILDYRYPSDRVDIYSLGCILYYMITGKSPKADDIKSARKSMGARTYRMIRKCTEVYNLRYKSAAELQKEVLYEIKRFPDRFPVSVIRRVPGFRSSRLWKMAAAVTYYGFFAMLLAMGVVDYVEGSLELFGFCGLLVLEYIIAIDVLHLRNLFPKYRAWREYYPWASYVVRGALMVAAMYLYLLLFV